MKIPAVIQSGPIGTANPSNPARALAPVNTLQQRGPAPARQHFADRRLNQIQSASQQATAQATASDDAACNVIRGVVFVANATQALQHYLGQTWTSYRVENVQTTTFPLTFARFVATRGSQDGSTISVTADANCVADVRVW